MLDFTFSIQFRSILYSLLESKTSIISDEDLVKSCMVFSPHFDDETLGCGGTIIHKVNRGAEVSVVFMTDGSLSHSQWMPADELSLLRKSEGIAALRELGVDDEKIFILGFPESRLMDHEGQVRREVSNLLELRKPDQLFLPYTREPLMWSSDHVDTTQIIRDEIRDRSWQITVYEYPIWAWFHYPWIRLRRGSLRQAMKNSLDFQFGALLLKDFNFRIDIENVMDQKWSALKHHRSQITELIPNVGWPTLGSVAEGDFLKLFFQKHEYFRKT